MRKIYFALLTLAALFTSSNAFAQWIDDEGIEYDVIDGTNYGTGAGEGAEKACDGNTSTKFGTSTYPNFVTLEASEDVYVIGYTITTANDNSSWTGRNPKNWKVQGSNDLSTWVTIDEVVGDKTMEDVDYTEYEFYCQPTVVTYQYIRFYVESSWGGGFMQYSEFHPLCVPSDHEHVWEKIDTVDPTCVDKGYTTYECEDCGAQKKDDYVDATGNHQYGDDGKCIVCGASNDAPAIVDGYMQLTSIKDFLYFADRINNNYDYSAKLTTDLDLTGTDFTPIGTGSNYGFQGTFDGQNHTITGITYNNANQDQVGLFAFATNATIKNFIIKDANIVGHNNTAGVVGRAYGCTIDNIAVLNSYIEGRDHTAAIAGDMNYTIDDDETVNLTNISNVVSDAVIYSREYQAGGLVGVTNGGVLEHSVFTGTVQCAAGSNACGLISLIDSDTQPSTIQYCVELASHLWADGNNRIVNAASRSWTGIDNYALATTNCGSKAGKNCSFREGNDPTDEQGCDVSDEEARTKDFYEGLGFDFTNTWKFIEGTEGKCYPVLAIMNAPLSTKIFDLPTDAKLIWSDGSESLDLKGIHGSWGQPLSFEVVSESNKVFYAEDENLIYIGDENGNYQGAGAPQVKVSIASEVAGNYNLSGDDTFSIYVAKSTDVIEISDVAGMQLMLRNMEGNYKLTQDIDMSGVNYPGIGDSNNPFMGTFDGDGHTISNLTINDVTRNQMGFFNVTHGATIKNLGVNQINIIGETTNTYGSQVGSLIGECISTNIENVAINGRVVARDHVGGFIGRTSGLTTIKNCFSAVNVQGFSQVGGITGTTGINADTDNITFENVYYSGLLHITSRGWAGGMIGLVDKSGTTIDMHGCVSIGDLTSNRAEGYDVNAVSPFIGGNGAYAGYVNSDGSINNEFGYAVITFYDNVENSDAECQGEEDYRWPEYGLTADGGDVEDPQAVGVGELQKADIYKSIGWDFDNVWKMSTDETYKFPLLKSLTTFVVYDGINEINTEDAQAGNNVIYNISGQRVGKNFKGIVIKNGKKYLYE